MPRQVAAAFIAKRGASLDTSQFLVVSSRYNPGKWVLPKGGVDPGETWAQAALRESHEEAGVVPEKCDFQRHILSMHHDSAKKSSDYHFELFLCAEDALAEDWLEKHERTRRWVSGADLPAYLVWNPGARDDMMRAALAALSNIWGDL